MCPEVFWTENCKHNPVCMLGTAAAGGVRSLFLAEAIFLLFIGSGCVFVLGSGRTRNIRTSCFMLRRCWASSVALCSWPFLGSGGGEESCYVYGAWDETKYIIILSEVLPGADILCVQLLSTGLKLSSKLLTENIFCLYLANREQSQHLSLCFFWWQFMCHLILMIILLWKFMHPLAQS